LVSQARNEIARMEGRGGKKRGGGGERGRGEVTRNTLEIGGGREEDGV